MHLLALFSKKNPLDQLNNEFYGPYFIFFQKNFQPRFAQHEYYSSFLFFWSHSADYFIHILFSYVHTFTL